MMKTWKVTSDNSMKMLDRLYRSHIQYIPVRENIVKDNFKQTYQGGYWHQVAEVVIHKGCYRLIPAIAHVSISYSFVSITKLVVIGIVDGIWHTPVILVKKASNLKLASVNTRKHAWKPKKNKIRWLGTEATAPTRSSIRRRKSWSCCWSRRDWKGKPIFSKHEMTNLTNHFSLKILRPWTATLLPVDQLPGNKISRKLLQLYLDKLTSFQPILKILSLWKMHQFLSLHHHLTFPDKFPSWIFCSP